MTRTMKKDGWLYIRETYNTAATYAARFETLEFSEGVKVTLRAYCIGTLEDKKSKVRYMLKCAE